MSSKPRQAVVSTGKAVALAAAPEAAIPLAVAEKAGEAILKVATGDIVVVRTIRNIGTKRKPVWQEREVHYNAISAGLGVLAIGVAAFVATSAWEGRTGGAFFGGSPGLKDNYGRFLDAHPELVQKAKLHQR